MIRRIPLLSARLSAIQLLVIPFSMACSTSPTEPDETRVIGTVWFYQQDVVIVVPDTVQAGVAFPVTVHTYGGGCERIGETEAYVDGSSAVVFPFDYTYQGSEYGCTDVLKVFRHETTVSFTQPGSARVEVHGRAFPEDEPRTEIRTVVVR